jgi:hypothetical protein
MSAFWNESLSGCYAVFLSFGRDAETDLHSRPSLIDVFVQMGFNDAIVIDPESLAQCILGDFQASVHVAAQTGRKEKPDA